MKIRERVILTEDWLGSTLAA